MLIWELAYKVTVLLLEVWKPYMFPSPLSVLTTLWRLAWDWSLFVAISTSLQRIAVGYGITVVLGVLLGLLMVRFQWINDQFRAMFLGIQTLPSICWMPFAVLWFGIGEAAILFVIVIGSVFAVALGLEAGVRQVPVLYLKASAMLGARGFTALARVVLPAALPSVVSGLKQSWSFAWRGLMAGEMLIGNKGLGQILLMGRDLADMSQVVVSMLVMIGIGLFVDAAIFRPIELHLERQWGLSHHN